MIEIEFDHNALMKHGDVLESLLVDLDANGSRSLEGGQKTLYGAIRRYLAQAETELREMTIGSMGLPNDPRASRFGVSRDKVKSKKGLITGQIKIFQPKTAGSNRSTYVQPRKLDQNPHQRGGNRVPRGKRTQDMLSYGPRDRGFILRWLENGIPGQRKAGTKGGKLGGNRGSISPRRYFSRASSSHIEQVMQNLAQKIDAKIEDLVNSNKI
jgi:hypothetical protein